MLPKGIKCILCLMLLFSAQPGLFATEPDDDKKHKVYLEGLGRSVIWLSMNYEYELTKRISLGTGLGYTNLSSRPMVRVNDGVYETGRHFELLTSQAIFANYFIGKSNHKLFFTGGFTNFWSLSRRKFDSDTRFFSDAQIRWNLGVGYQYSTSHVFVRFTAYALRLPEPVGIFPEIVPWAGISLGYRF
jgi:hypothetical protein